MARPARRLYRARRNPRSPSAVVPLVGGAVGAGLGYWYATAGSTPPPASSPALASQVGLVSGQLAQVLVPLGNYADNAYASEMYMPASNTVGAWLRVSYWLAVAGRIALGRGWAPTATSLQAQALRAFANACGLAGISAATYLSGSVGALLASAMQAVNPVASVTPVDSTDPGAVRQVFDAGVAALSGADVSQVEALLTRLAGTPPRPETSLSQRITLPSFAPDWLKSWWGGATTATWVGVGAALGGATAYGVVKMRGGGQRSHAAVRRNPDRITGSVPAWLVVGVGVGLLFVPGLDIIGGTILLGTLGIAAAKSL